MAMIDATALLAGDRRALARAITLIESTRVDHQRQAHALLEQVLPRAGKSYRIGISGSPGVGKSTFVEAFGLHALDQGRRLAVLAVDPSSPRSGGSILGDKTRMPQLTQRPDVFVRPSPASKRLGGVAQATRECILLCEAAGYDTVIVETVGTGQSEYEVAEMVDCFLVLLLPNAGDELQGIKRGLIELADALLINKSDGANVRQASIARAQYSSALQLIRPRGSWRPRVIECSALEGKGIGDAWELVEAFFAESIQNGELERQRSRQNAGWLQTLFIQALQAQAAESAHVRTLLGEMQRRVVDGSTTPFAALQHILSAIRS